MIPTLIGITFFVFVVTRLVPGGPVEKLIMSEQNAIGKTESDSRGVGASMKETPLSEEQLQQLKEYYGFDKPILTSYLLWLKKIVILDLGISSRYQEPVWDIIKSKLPVSTFFGLMTFFLVYIICIPLGILKALKHKTSFDTITSIAVFIGYAVPGFVVGIFLLIVFSEKLSWFPLSGFVSREYADLSLWGKIVDFLRHITLPLISYLLGSFAVMTLLMKNTLLDHMASEYVRTAMAKGLSFRSAVFKHALRNSLIPIATTCGHIVSAFLMGSILIETVFNLDGFGLLGFESIIERDYPVVMGILVIQSVLFLLGNIISDFCVALVDPRVQFD